MELIYKPGSKINYSDEILEIESLLKKYCLCIALISVIKSKASMETKQQCAGELSAQGIEFDLSNPVKYQTKLSDKSLMKLKRRSGRLLRRNNNSKIGPYINQTLVINYGGFLCLFRK